MNLTKILPLLLAAAMVFPAQEGLAQRKKKKKNKGKTEETSKPKKDGKSPEELTKKCVAYEGLFNVYQDSTDGKTFLQVKEDQLGKEFIYFSFVEDGVLEAGHFRGAYRGAKVVSFHKVFDRIEVRHQNTSYYFDEDSPLSKAKDANINTPILASVKIEAKDDSAGTYLISGSDLFLSENFQMIKPPANPKRPGFLGRLSKDKTKVEDIRSYPANTDVEVMYVYDNANPKGGASYAVTDTRYISIRYQHSLIEMPENNFEPRRDDGRIGYFMSQVNDMTSFDPAPYRDVIHRWHLEKKDPSAAISDPVEPLVFWIENTTPLEFRPIIKEGVERWNDAFAKAGFSNAVVVKIQPDDADWDAGDIRYNVLRWTSSPIPPFGGYGPSFVNPRTGQILGADIMLEFSAIRGRLFRKEIFDLAGLPAQEDLSKEDIIADMHRCDMGAVMQRNTLFGMSAIAATRDMEEAAKEEFVKQTLYRLVLHEVGHTLGLSHNMRASTMLSPEEIKDKAIVAEKGLCNSVMEYPAINFARNKEDQTTYYDSAPGPYDHWVIEYGYSQAADNADAEEKRLQQILSRSSEPDLMFGNDADDMRGAGRGIDPDINIYDLSNDPVAYAVERCETVNDILPKIKDTYLVDGESTQELLTAYFALTGEYITQINVMTRQIGGVHFDRTAVGQKDDLTPLQPVSEKEQKAAMNALRKYAFAPDAMSVSDDLYNYLLPQRRGFNHFGRNQDPHIHSRIQLGQSVCLAHLLHPNTLTRILDSEEYGNTYGLDEVMTDLTNSIFQVDYRTKVNTRRQNLQVMYVQKLTAMIGEKSKHTLSARSMALYELKRIRKNMKSASSPDTMTKAHRAHVIQLVDDALES